MIRKEAFFASFLLFFCLDEIGCQKITLDNVKAIRNGSIQCEDKIGLLSPTFFLEDIQGQFFLKNNYVHVLYELCQKPAALFTKTFEKGNFTLKYEKVIDSKKLNLTWYNPDNPHGISFTLDEASGKLIENDIFWRYPSLNIYVSGYGFSSKTVDSYMFRKEFLRIQKPIILIDYSAYSGTSDPGFVEACHSLYNIGEIIAKFIIDMVNAGVETKDIHCIGLSLGGQLVGYMARAFQRNYGQNMGRVTGIDPAGPCFDRASLDENLKKEDADFVDIYNFNRGQLGTLQILGHANFLINGGGNRQKPCERLAFVNMLYVTYSMRCAHAITSVAYWKHSIQGSRRTSNAIQCVNLDEAVRQDCDGDEVNAGLDVSLSARGIFYVYYDYSSVLTLSQAAIAQLLSVAGK